MARGGYWIVGVVLVAALTSCVKPLREEVWREVSSDRFRVVSNIEVEEAKQIVVDLERFHSLIEQTTNIREYESPIPNEIIAFRERRQLKQFTKSRRIGGLFMAGLRSNLMLLARQGKRTSASEVMLHEYVHFVVQNGAQFHAPLWYNEGFAEFLSTAKVDNGKMIVGGVPHWRINAIASDDWFPAHELVEMSNTADLSRWEGHVFYAQSWLLVHYLNLDRKSDQKMAEGLGRYIAMLREGAGPVTAFEHGFGEDIDELNRNLRDTADRRNGLGINLVGLPIEKLDFDREPPRVRTLPADEVAVAMGTICIRFGDWDCVVEEARAAIQKRPSNARAHALLGDGYKFTGRWDEAGVEFERALELDPGDFNIRMDRAQYLLDRAQATPEPNERRARLEAAREEFRELADRSARNPEAWLMLAASYLVAGEDASKAVEPAERALALLPSSPFVKQVRAEAYLANGREREAERALQEWLGLRHAAGSGDTVRLRMKAMIQKRETQAKKLGIKAEPD